MPWNSIGYDKKRYNELMKKFKLKAIPRLVLLKENGNTEEAIKIDCVKDITLALQQSQE